MNYLIIDKLKEINQLQNIIKSSELDYEGKSGKKTIFSVNTHYILFLLRDVYNGNLSLKDGDEGQSKLIYFTLL